MCYHYTLSSPPEKLSVRFDAEILDEYEQLYYHNDGFAHNAMPVITADDPNSIQRYHWGLVPHLVKTDADAKKLSNQTLNAKSETVFDLPSFKMYIGKKRCLVLTDGFFEWRHEGKSKYPHFIYMKNKEPFAFAGIYSHWKSPTTGEITKSYSILTTEANTLMKKIHNSKERMPVILKPEMEKIWLKPDLMKEEIKDLMLPLDDNFLTAHTISKLITSKSESSNQPQVVDMWEYPELALLG
jgi:putative SOS response-associated peptidase YedK